MSVLEAGLRLRTGPLPTSPRPLPLTQMKVGAGLESASQVRVTLSRPSLTGAEAELRTVALGETETETVRVTWGQRRETTVLDQVTAENLN